MFRFFSDAALQSHSRRATQLHKSHKHPRHVLYCGTPLSRNACLPVLAQFYSSPFTFFSCQLYLLWTFIVLSLPASRSCVHQGLKVSTVAIVLYHAHLHASTLALDSSHRWRHWQNQRTHLQPQDDLLASKDSPTF